MLRGIPVSEGIGIGRAYVIGKQEIKEMGIRDR